MSHFDTDGQEKTPLGFSSDELDAVTMVRNSGQEQWKSSLVFSRLSRFHCNKTMDYSERNGVFQQFQPFHSMKQHYRLLFIKNYQCQRRGGQ